MFEQRRALGFIGLLASALVIGVGARSGDLTVVQADAVMRVPASPMTSLAERQPNATPSATPAASQSVSIEVVNDRYSPRAVEIAVGTTVRWINHDGVTHTVSSPDDHFDSGIMRRGTVFTETFETPGVYRYGCDLHLEMYGTVLVR